MEITDSPHRPGTPEHDEWVRTTFIPGIGRDRWESDGAKYGAASIGKKRTRVLDDDDDDGPEIWPDSTLVSASGYTRGGTAKADRAAAGVYKTFTNKIINLTFTFKDFDAAMMQAFGFDAEEIKRRQDRRRRQEEAAMWLDVPEWAWRGMSLNERRSFGRVRVWSPQHGGSYVYFDNGERLPEYGPPRPPRRQPIYMPNPPPSRLCPRHGGPADRCRPCQRSSHGR